MAQTPSSLPWQRLEREPLASIFGTCNGKPTVYQVCQGQGGTRDEAETNAAFVLQAVNSHAALLAALEAGYLYALQSDGVLRIKNQATLIMMRSAIADATGRTDQDVQDDFESRAALAKQVS